MIIGLTGVAGSGKDTVAALLAMRGFTRYAFADELREEVVRYFNALRLDPEQRWFLAAAWGAEVVTAVMEGRITPETVYAKPVPPLMRQLLQRHGTEFRRTQNPNYWVSKLMAQLDEKHQMTLPHVEFARASGLLATISDVRFANEADAIRERGGKIWRVVRGVATGFIGDSGHISESGQSEIVADETLINDGTVYDLAMKVRALL
jgi:hypothetical protein